MQYTPAYLICGLCYTKRDLRVPLDLPHLAVLHAVIDHGLPMEAIVRSRRYRAPRGSVSWWFPNARAWLIVWRRSGTRL